MTTVEDELRGRIFPFAQAQHGFWQARSLALRIDGHHGFMMNSGRSFGPARRDRLHEPGRLGGGARDDHAIKWLPIDLPRLAVWSDLADSVAELQICACDD